MRLNRGIANCMPMESMDAIDYSRLKNKGMNSQKCVHCALLFRCVLALESTSAATTAMQEPRTAATKWAAEPNKFLMSIRNSKTTPTTPPSSRKIASK